MGKKPTERPARRSGVECSIAIYTCGSTMGIKFLCPNGHKLNVKTFLAGKKGVCPECRERFVIPLESTPKQPVASIGVSSAGAHADEEVEEDAADDGAEVAGPYHAAAVSSTPNPANSNPANSNPAKIAAPIADPLDEAPNAQWYVRPPTGGQFGPARADLLRRWIGEGRVSADSLVWREGWADWKPAGGLLPGIDAPAVSQVAPSPTMPHVARSASGASGGGGPGSAAPSFLAGGEAAAAISPVSAAARTTAVVPRKSSNMLPIVIVMALIAIVMLVVLIWVVMSN